MISMWYIKKPTRKFTAKYGLPAVEDLNTYIELYHHV